MQRWSVLLLICMLRGTIVAAQESDSAEVGNGITEQERVDEESKVMETDKAAQAGRTMVAQFKDERLESREGPNGEPILVTHDDKYYYVNRKGEKIFLEKTALKARQ